MEKLTTSGLRKSLLMPPNSEFYSSKFLYFSRHENADFFNDSVIFLCEHSKNGAFGFVMNQPTDLSESILLSKLNLNKNSKHETLKHVLRGGPVDTDRLFVLHNANDITFQQTTQISDDLFLTTSNDILESIARKKINAKYKIIVGYCGWAPGQLESEIKQNAWHIVSSDMNLVFDTLPNLIVDKLSEKIGYNLRTIISGESTH